MASSGRRPHIPPVRVPLAISARHVHLTQRLLERLFGAGHTLTVRAPLSQPGHFAAHETVALVGPKHSITHVRVVGPLRSEDQVEISRTDEIHLGLDAPLRDSGNLAETPGIVLVGPHGRVALDHGVIRPCRHIHMSPADATALGLVNGARVAVDVINKDHRMMFGDVLVRVAPEFRLELHLDTDEGNATGLSTGDEVVLVELASFGLRPS